MEMKGSGENTLLVAQTNLSSEFVDQNVEQVSEPLIEEKNIIEYVEDMEEMEEANDSEEEGIRNVI